MKLIITFIFTILLIYGCNTTYEYAKRIDNCHTKQIKEFLGNGDVKFTENPFRDCMIENVIGQDFPNVTLSPRYGDKFKLSEIDKPIFLQVFSRSIKQCTGQVNAINEFAEKYSDSIIFVILIDKEPDGWSTIGPRLKRKMPGYVEFHTSIKQIIYDEKDIKQTGYSKTVKGIKCTGFPMTYLLTKDKKINDIESIEDVLVNNNIIFKQDNSIPKDSLYYLSTRRFDKKLKELLIE